MPIAKVQRPAFGAGRRKGRAGGKNASITTNVGNVLSRNPRLISIGMLIAKSSGRIGKTVG